jgi:hypothetical protein
VKQHAKAFLERITEVFGPEDTITRIAASDGGPAVHVFFFKDLPEPGMLTAVTYGLSESDNPDWVSGRPELIVTLETQDESWGEAVGQLAAELRVDCPFAYGNLFPSDQPIASESDMAGFFCFAPSFLDRDDATLQIADRTIFLKGMYPVYREELELIKRVGLKDFWHMDGYDMYDVRRPNLGCPARRFLVTIMAGVAVETGYKELRPIVLIPEDSELWPGLAIDFSLAPPQRKLAVKEKEEGAENAPCCTRLCSEGRFPHPEKVETGFT